MHLNEEAVLLAHVRAVQVDNPLMLASVQDSHLCRQPGRHSVCGLQELQELSGALAAERWHHQHRLRCKPVGSPRMLVQEKYAWPRSGCSWVADADGVEKPVMQLQHIQMLGKAHLG